VRLHLVCVYAQTFFNQRDRFGTRPEFLLFEPPKEGHANAASLGGLRPRKAHLFAECFKVWQHHAPSPYWFGKHGFIVPGNMH